MKMPNQAKANLEKSVKKNIMTANLQSVVPKRHTLYPNDITLEMTGH